MRWTEINEAREAYLYHITTAENVDRILAANELKALTDHRAERLGMTGSRKVNQYGYVTGVSLTRNPAFSKIWRSGQGVVLVLDPVRLRNRTELRPTDYYAGSDKNTGYGSPRSEAEEFAIGGIRDLDRSLVEIRINRELYQQCCDENENYPDIEYKPYWHLTSSPKLKII